MARAHRLLDSQVRAFSAKSKDRWVNDGNGLYIRIRPNGTKTWVLRRKIHRKTKKTTLGSYPSTSLKKARLLAAAQRTQDEEHKQIPAALDDSPTLFGELLNQYYNDHIEPNYRRPRQVRMYIDNRVPDDIKGLRVSDLDAQATREFRVLIRTFLRRYAETSGPVGANRLLAIFKQSTKFGTAIGYLTVDPLRELTRKLVGGDDKSSSRTLTNDEIRLVWNAQSGHQPLLRFLLLTGQRIGEAQAMLWTDIKDGKWHIPPEISKNGRPHWVPLTNQINALLDSLSKGRRKVFKSISATATQAWLRRWCERENISPNFTPHDLRRTFVTELNEIGVEPYIIERLVNHSMSGVMAVYNKAEYESERIVAADVWSKQVLSVVSNDD